MWRVLITSFPELESLQFLLLFFRISPESFPVWLRLFTSLKLRLWAQNLLTNVYNSFQKQICVEERALVIFRGHISLKCLEEFSCSWISFILMETYCFLLTCCKLDFSYLFYKTHLRKLLMSLLIWGSVCLLLLNYPTLFDHSIVENIKPHIIVIINNQSSTETPCLTVFFFLRVALQI